MNKTNKIKRASHTVRRRSRPLHKRMLLHPISALLLLCTGVLVTAATFQSQAASYDLSATVPAAQVTAPAIITSLSSEQHVSTPVVAINGACPSQSYVKLYRNNQLSSVAPCQSSMFHAQTNLSAGPNQLQAKVYNTTDNEGPSSPSIVVHYDAVTSEPQKPAEAPTVLRILELDTTAYKQNISIATSSRPTVSGYAPPYSTVVVTFHSEIKTCKTTANGEGWWTCTLSQDLPAGVHSVDVVATTPDGKTLTLPTMRIMVTIGLANLLIAAPLTTPLTLTHSYHYQTRYPGELWKWDMNSSGGTPPYKAIIDWDDGSTTIVNPGNETTFTMSHTFNTAGSYQPVVTLTDASGNKTLFQLSAIVKPSQNAVFSSSSNLLSDTRSYLWIIWPAYIIVLLMVVSFWLGEREIIKRFRRGNTAHNKLTTKH